MEEIPQIVREAYSRLVDSGLVTISRALAPVDNGDYDFVCTAKIKHPNPEGLPPVVELRAILTSAFPFAPVKIISLSPEVRGFPHQDAETHKLCLRKERDAPCSAERLITYVQWTLEWLDDAANGQLLAIGHPYELPDFSRKLLTGTSTFGKPLWFIESHESLAFWQNRVGQDGKVDVILSKVPNVAFARVFEANDGAVLTVPVSSSFATDGPTLCAAWILLQSLAYFRNRPPQTFGELRSICDASGVNLAKIIRDLWVSQAAQQTWSVLLIGAPIPIETGAPPHEVHWQPVYFENAFAESDGLGRRFGTDKRRKQWDKRKVATRFANDTPLNWGCSLNVSEERLIARGAVSVPLRSSRIAMIGCGALGSVIIEQLVRSGVRDISLMDSDSFEPGNHVRHTLDGSQFGRSKATALRIRLQPGSPQCRIRDHVVSIPSFASESGREALEDLQNADLLIDCSANEAAFNWLSHFAYKKKRFVHMFISHGARFLTMVFSGKSISTRQSLSSFCKIAQTAGISTITHTEMIEYFSEPTGEELVVPGAGCWHATFPARLNHIQSLVGVAFDVLEEIVSLPERCAGTVVILRRNNVFGTTNERIARIEEIHRGHYR